MNLAVGVPLRTLLTSFHLEYPARRPTGVEIKHGFTNVVVNQKLTVIR